MIPLRMLSNEIGGSGLRDRVTACRQRLRVNRVTHLANTLIEADELFPESEVAVAEFHCHPTDYSAPANTLTTEEHEVGIT